MKTLCMLLLLASASVPALAQVGKPESAAPPSESSAAEDARQHMKTMQELMNKLEKSTDPAERKRLLEQHRSAMHEQLQAMKNMECGPAMHPAHAAGKPHGNGQMMGGGMMMSGDMMKCHETMQARMGMMLGLMDQMMRHEEAMHHMP
jgi:hypothetical protein